MMQRSQNVDQRCLVLCAYLVDILWFSVKPFGNLSILLLILCFGIYLHSILCIAFEGTVLWNAQLAGLFVVDITVLCLSICVMIVFLQDLVEKD
jgi:hypothetical protein